MRNQNPCNENNILYFSTFSQTFKALINIFKKSDLALVKLESIDNLYEHIGNEPKLIILDIIPELGCSNDYIFFRDYFTCPIIYIFEDSKEVIDNSEFLSNYHIYGLSKSDQLIDNLKNLIIKLQLIDQQEEYLVLENLEIETHAKITSQMSSLSNEQFTIGKPGITEINSFHNGCIYFPHFNHKYFLNKERISTDGTDLIIKDNMLPLIKQLEIFGFKNKHHLTIAFIAESPPQYKYFHNLGVKVKYYENIEKFEGNEEVIIIEDVKIDPKTTSGTEFCIKEEYKKKNILILGRILATKKYLHPNLMTTTVLFDSDKIHDFIQKNSQKELASNVYHFDLSDNLTSANISLPCTITSLNENWIKIDLPFKLLPTSKVEINFLGKTTFTVLSSEKSSNGFSTELMVDNLSENQLNFFRRMLNKLYYLDSKSIDINTFDTLEKVDCYIISENIKEA